MENEDHENNEAYQRALWEETYGEMVPEKIVDTKIGADGKRYYKVQWAQTTMEAGKNFLEAELLIKKYWDPVEKKLKFPSRERENEADEEERASSSRQHDDGDKSNETTTTQNEHVKSSKDDDSVTSTDPIVTNVNEKEGSEVGKGNDIDENSCVEDRYFVTHLEDTNGKEEENHLKRKRSNSTETNVVTISSSVVTNAEVATKKVKDDGVDEQ